MGLFGKKYDVFISYKSKNVDMARLIADRLIASNRKAWFAEYQVLLTDRHRFQEAIDIGIRESRYGLALTNNDYARSPYCDAEMAQLLKSCGPRNVMEIMIPSEPMTHRKYPQLASSPAHIFTGDIDEALRFVGRTSGWEIVPRIKIADEGLKNSFEGECLDDAYTIDVTGWELVEKSFHGGGPCYARRIEGVDVFWNLQFGEEVDPKVYDGRLGTNQENERILYNGICDYARHYFSDLKPGSRVIGAHLLYYQGQSQFAVTYYDGRDWKRRYSLMLLHPKTCRAAEFLFTFQFSGPFSQYCRCVESMDALVLTLRWGGQPQGDAGQASRARPSPQEDRAKRIIDDQPMANKFYHEGISLAKRGLLRDATKAWEKVLEFTTLAELRGATLYNMGRAHERMGDLESALSSYRQSAESNPGQFNALCNMGALYLRQGRPQEALKPLLAAHEFQPGDYITVNNIVVCYEDIGKPDEAASWRAKLSRLKPPC